MQGSPETMNGRFDSGSDYWKVTAENPKKGLMVEFDCPHCGHHVSGLLAVWSYYETDDSVQPILLMPAMADSCGLYGMYIRCPLCDNDIDVMA